MSASGAPDEGGPAGSPALDLLLARLPRLALVVGKGGVGKTTCAAALALRAARAQRVLLLSTDPARTLGAAIGATLGPEPRPVTEGARLHAMQLDAEAARAAFLAKWRATIVTIVDRGTYLDLEDVAGLVDSAFPGADEAMALLSLADVVADARWERVIADTAPTGHTLRLLALPATFRALVALLETMQDKHRFMVSALTHRYRADAADAFLAEMRERVAALEGALRDPARCAAVVVARPEGVVLDETERLAASLAELGIARGAVVANAVPAAGDAGSAEAMARLRAVAGDAPLLRVPDVGALAMGWPAIERWSAAAERDGGAESLPMAAEGWRPADDRGAHSPAGGGPPAGAALPVDLLVRPLTIVGGKGGVGKTTIACALALAASAGRRVLLVSTDPAPSIADALAQPVGDAETPVAGAGRLTARQMDAARAFERLRTTYQARIDTVFDGLVSGGMDATHDRRVLRDLLALAPPGIDELYALGALGDTLEEGHFDVVVVDPAPTGHLLRLLEMPALALEWSHRLMRLMLKYKEVTGLGDAAAEVLAFARRTRRVGELLRDPARAGLVIAALDEPLVRDESRRLARAVAALGVPLAGVVWNRASGGVAPLGDGLAVPQFLAGAAAPPPRGPEALLRWLDGWRPLPAP